MDFETIRNCRIFKLFFRFYFGRFDSTVDRNGLRPLRYYQTVDNILVETLPQIKLQEFIPFP